MIIHTGLLHLTKMDRVFDKGNLIYVYLLCMISESINVCIFVAIFLQPVIALMAIMNEKPEVMINKFTLL